MLNGNPVTSQSSVASFVQPKSVTFASHTQVRLELDGASQNSKIRT